MLRKLQSGRVSWRLISGELGVTHTHTDTLSHTLTRYHTRSHAHAHTPSHTHTHRHPQPRTPPHTHRHARTLPPSCLYSSDSSKWALTARPCTSAESPQVPA